MFSVAETDETVWDDSYALALGRGTDAAQLLELMGIWRYIGERRGQFLEYGRSLRRLADLEYLAEAESIDLHAAAEKGRRKCNDTRSAYHAPRTAVPSRRGRNQTSAPNLEERVVSQASLCTAARTKLDAARRLTSEERGGV